MPVPTPTRRAFRPLSTPEEEDELAARRAVHAGILPANMARHQSGDGNPHASPDQRGTGGGGYSREQGMRGWTAQQPYEHVDCPVLHICVFCARVISPDTLRQHVCRVLNELEQ